MRNIINIYQEEKWSKDRTCGTPHPTGNLTAIWEINQLNYICEIAFNPFMRYTPRIP